MRIGLWGVSLGGVVLLAGAMLGGADKQPAVHPQHLHAAASPAVKSAAAPAILARNFGARPLTFTANEGQTDPRVQFTARGRGYSLFLTGGEAVLAFSQNHASNALLPIRGQGVIASGGSHGNYARNSHPEAVVRLKLAGANPAAVAQGRQKLLSRSSYYLGNDPGKWRSQVPNYARVEYRGIYPGVDLVYYGNQNQLEHDFVVAPGADAGAIRLRVSGARPHLDARGNLILAASGANPTLQKPVIYQTTPAGRELVAGGYTLAGNTLGFSLGSYDHSLPLVIDPVLTYSTYLGGDVQDIAEDVKVDAAGNVFVIGLTESDNFPVTNGSMLNGGEDAFVTEFDPTGSSLLLSMYLGGSLADAGVSLALDSSDNIFTTGVTTSTDFPITSSAFQKTLRGGSNAFLTEFNSAGTIVYSSYFGGNGQTAGFGIALDSSDNIYITGQTDSTNLPVLNNFQGPGGLFDGFAAKFNSTGSALVFSTYMGGSGTDRGFYVAVDSAGNSFYAGATSSSNFPTTKGVVQRRQPGLVLSGYAVELGPTGAQMWGTYLGGVQNDVAIGIALDASDNVYLTGYTRSGNFPISPGAFQTTFGGVVDGFLSVLSSNAQRFVFSTYLGGAQYDSAEFVTLDSSGNVYVVGNTLSTNFPTMNPIQAAYAGGALLGDGFIAEFTSDGSALSFSTYLGGSSDDVLYSVAVDSSGNIHAVGQTYSDNWPTTSNAFQNTFAGGISNAVVVKIAPTGKKP